MGLYEYRVRTNLSPKVFIAASTLAASLAISPLTLAAETIGQVTNTPQDSPYSGNLIIDSDDNAAIHGTDENISIETTANGTENGDVTMNVGEAHGILAELVEGNSIEINAAGTVIIRPEGSNSGDDGDGINVTEENKGSLSLTAGVSNVIYANSKNGDGIYIDGGSSGDLTLVANGSKENGNIIESENNGIDHRGSQTITLQATNGINSIKTQRGDGLRLEGVGTIALHGYDNKVIAGDNGIQVSQGTIQLNASNNNFIEGASTGIQIEDKGGTVSVSAVNTNEIRGGQYGVNVSNKSNSLSQLDIVGEKNKIVVSGDNDKTDAAGISAYGNTDINIEGDTHIVTSTDSGQSTATYGVSLGHTNMFKGGSIHFKDSSVNIETSATSGNVTGLNLRQSSLFEAQDNISNFRVVATNSGNEGDVAGIYVNNSTLKINALGDVQITAQDSKENTTKKIIKGIDSSGGADVTINASNISIDAYSHSGDYNKINSMVTALDTNGARISLEAMNDIYLNSTKNPKSSGRGIAVLNGGAVELIAGNSNYIYANTGIWATGRNPDPEEGAIDQSNGAVLIKAKNNFIYASEVGVNANGNNSVDTSTTITLDALNNLIYVGSDTGTSTVGRGILSNSGSHVVVGNEDSLNTTITVENQNASTYYLRGLDVQYSGRVSVTSDEINLNVIDTVPRNYSNKNYGIYAYANAVVDFNAKKDIKIYAENAFGVFSDWGSTIALDGNNNFIETTKAGAVSAQNYWENMSAVVTLNATDSNYITADAEKLNGRLFGKQYAAYALKSGLISITANNNNQLLGAVYSNSGTDTHGTSVSIKGNRNIVASNTVISNAGGLQSDPDFSKNRVISALYAQGKDSSINLSAKENYLSTFADSSVHTDLERVVWAYDGADINIDGFTSITTDSYEKSLNSIDIAIAAGTAVNLTEDIVTTPVEDRAQVQINYANTTDSEGKAVLSSVTGDILSAYAGSVNIAPKSASDGLVVTGNLLAGNNGKLTVDIGANGVLTGRADDYGDAGFIKDSEHTTFFDPAFSSEIFKGGQVNLKLGYNARWNVTGQSWITDISVADGAKNVLIDLVNANTDRNSTAHALTVYNLNGNATFNMSLDGNRDVSDMLYIRNANGEYNVNVVDAVTVDDMYKGGLNGLRFATVGAGSKAKFRAFTYDKGALNVEYEVATDSYDNNPENDIYNGTEMSHEKPGSTVVDGLFGYEEGAVATLALNDEAATKAADGTISETTNFKLVDRKDATPSDSGKTIIDHARANYANAVQLDTLNKRQGEMRFSQGHEDGLWARIRHDDIGKRSSFRLDNTMVEVGVDSRYVKETGEFHTGVAFDYMNGDTDYHHISGEGDLDRYGVWFYTTWLGNEGDYTDFIIKCSLIDNEYKIYAPTTGEKITGDYDNNVISVSLEHGKKYSNEESWFIEPQAQLQYAYVTSAEYTNSQGTDVRLDGIHSLIGRVGVRAGKDVTRDNPFTFYARGDIMHEFMGKQDIKAKDATGTMRVRYENDDTWYSAGLGMSYLHNKDKYYFLEAEKVFGGSNTSSYIVSGGVRFLFD